MNKSIVPEALWTPEGIRQGWHVGIDASRIVEVGPAPRHPADGIEVVRLPGRLLLPGLVNAHSHAFQRAFRGHVRWAPAGRDDFWSWRDRMYGVANALRPEDVEAISALAFLEMAEAGVTRVGEFHYLHHQPDGTPYDDPDELARRVLAAAEAAGIGITLLRVAYARGGAGQPLRPDQRRFGDAHPDDVLAALGSDHAYTTVLSVLQKLEKAGWVAHTKQGRTYVWRSARTRDEERQSSLGAVVDRLFRGNPVVAFQHLLDDERIGEKELAELRKLIETKEEELGR